MIALAGAMRLQAGAAEARRDYAFDVRPRVEFDNQASNRFTVVEISARDRPALLNRLARALFETRLIVHSAHIATYGERAVDVFYLTRADGKKLGPDDAEQLRAALLRAASEQPQAAAA